MRLNAVTRYLIDQLNHAASLLERVAQKRKRDDVHEFRVALRRVRSLAKLYLEASAPFPNELKSAIKATNPIRELDVLIESVREKKYPKTAKYLARMRRKRARSLFTPEYARETLSRLHGYCDTLTHTHPAIPRNQLIRIVEESYNGCLEGYNGLDEKTPQKEFHRLRVKFKNTRYGLEFLNAAGMRNEHDKISECKSFQNSMGAVQDGYNQILWLKKIARKHPYSEIKKLLKKRKKKVRKLKAASRSAQSSGIRDTRSSG